MTCNDDSPAMATVTLVVVKVGLNLKRESKMQDRTTGLREHGLGGHRAEPVGAVSSGRMYRAGPDLSGMVRMPKVIKKDGPYYRKYHV